MLEIWQNKLHNYSFGYRCSMGEGGNLHIIILCVQNHIRLSYFIPHFFDTCWAIFLPKKLSIREYKFTNPWSTHKF